MKNMLLNISWLKILFAGLIGTVCTFLIPIKMFLIGTLVLVAIDTVTGIWKAKKNGEAITSKGFRRTTSKIIAYFLAILLAEMFRLIWLKDIALPYYVSAYISLTELKSNLENLSVITGIDIWNAIKSYVNQKIPSQQDEH